MAPASSIASRTSPTPSSRGGGLGRWLVHGAALLAVAMWLAVFANDTIHGWPGGLYQLSITVTNAVVGLVYTGVGWLIASRRPGNAVGPLLLAYGVIWSASGPVDVYLVQLPTRRAPPALADYAATFMFTIGIPLSAIRSLTLIVFPDGRALSRRWAAAALAGVAFAAIGVAGIWLGSPSFAPFYPRLGSPFAVTGFPAEVISDVADKALTGLFLLSLAAVVVRWVRGTKVERAQVKWIAAAGILGFVADRVAIAFGGSFDTMQVLTNVLAGFGSTLVPLAIGIAVMRYRLYDIDRIVSRTVAWAAVTATLVVVFLTVNLTLLAVISSLLDESGGTISIAASTLTVAAMFNPLRVRAQHVVDRRFHRERYDAGRVVDGFGGRLRNQLDLPLLEHDLRATAVHAVEPATTGLWLRTR